MNRISYWQKESYFYLISLSQHPTEDWRWRTWDLIAHISLLPHSDSDIHESSYITPNTVVLNSPKEPKGAALCYSWCNILPGSIRIQLVKMQAIGHKTWICMWLVVSLSNPSSLTKTMVCLHSTIVYSFAMLFDTNSYAVTSNLRDLFMMTSSHGNASCLTAQPSSNSSRRRLLYMVIYAETFTIFEPYKTDKFRILCTLSILGTFYTPITKWLDCITLSVTGG